MFLATMEKPRQVSTPLKPLSVKVSTKKIEAEKYQTYWQQKQQNPLRLLQKMSEFSSPDQRCDESGKLDFEGNKNYQITPIVASRETVTAERVIKLTAIACRGVKTDIFRRSIHGYDSIPPLHRITRTTIACKPDESDKQGWYW